MTTTNNTTNIQKLLEAQENETLIHRWAVHKSAIDEAREEMQQIEFVLTQRMTKDGATAIPDELYDVRLELPAPSYDVGKLAKLREFLPQDVIATAWTPEHEETVTVAERWDARVMKGFVKFGNEVAEIIEAAKVPGIPKLRIRAKK